MTGVVQFSKRLVLLVMCVLLVSANMVGAAPGDLDTSFDSDGIISWELWTGERESNDYIMDAAIGYNGAIRFVGYFAPAVGKTLAVIGGGSSVASVFQTDPLFGEAGYLILDFGGTTNQLRGVDYINDGTWVAAGMTDTAGNTKAVIVRCDMNGSLMESFGTEGVVILGDDSAAYTFESVKALSDGSFVAAGSTGGFAANSFYLAKVNASGAPVSTFGTDGVVTFCDGDSCSVTDLAVAADDKLIAVGFSISGGDYDLVLFKLNADGSMDTTFGTGGKVVVDIGAYDLGAAVELLTDGKIVVAGTVEGPADKDFLALKFNADGTPDTTFGVLGQVVVDVGNEDEAKDLVILPNESILVFGNSDKAGIMTQATVKLLPSGVVDTTFGPTANGLSTYDNSSDQSVSAEAGVYNADPSSKTIYVFGTDYNPPKTHTDYFIGHIQEDGKYAQEFEETIMDMPGPDYDSGTGIALGADGKFYIAGNTGTETFTARFYDYGSLDTSYNPINNSGLLRYGQADRTHIYDMALTASKKVVFAGYETIQPTTDTMLVIGTPGSYDTIKPDYGSDIEEKFFALALMPEGLPVAVGYSESSHILFRSLLNATADPSFGTAGMVTDKFEDTSRALGVTTLADGSIIIAGVLSQGTQINAFIAKYTSAGVLDTTFGSSGKTVAYYGGDDIFSDIIAQPDGKFVAAGRSGENILFVRFNADGSKDTSFGTGGIAAYAETKGNLYSTVHRLKLDDKNRIVACGFSDDNAAVWRLKTDGSLDADFGQNGKTVIDTYTISHFNDVAIQSDGSIIVVGDHDAGEAKDNVLIAKIKGGDAAAADTPPTAGDDNATTPKNTMISIDVLANDSDADGDTLSISHVSDPPNGTAAANASKIDYTPDSGFVGTDVFTYTVSDGNGGSDTGTVTVTVTDSSQPAAKDYTGWWYTPGEGGTGLSVGMSADKNVIFLAWYVYDAAGEAIWYVAWCQRSPGTESFTGDVRRYIGAPLGTFADEGDLTLNFADESNGILSWDMTKLRANPGSKAIAKYMADLDAGADDPAGINGWWADSANYPATGVFVEAKGTTLYLGWYHYRGTDDTPVWKVMGGFMDPGGFDPNAGTYTATVKEISGGQTVGGAYQPPVIPGEGTNATLTFTKNGSSMTFNSGTYTYNLTPYTITMP